LPIERVNACWRKLPEPAKITKEVLKHLDAHMLATAPLLAVSTLGQ